MTEEKEQLGRGRQQKATKDRVDIRKEEHTTFAYSTEGNTRHRGTEAV